VAAAVVAKVAVERAAEGLAEAMAGRVVETVDWAAVRGWASYRGEPVVERVVAAVQ